MAEPEFKIGEDGTVKLVREGQDPVVLTPEQVEEWQTAASQDLKDREVTITVDGSSRKVTVGEALDVYNKELAGDKKLRESAQAVKVLEAIHKMQDPEQVSAEDFDLVLREMGQPAEARQQALALFEQMKSGEIDMSQVNAQDNPDSEDDVKLGWEHLSPEIQQAIRAGQEASKASEQQEYERFVQQVENSLKKTLTEDPKLGKIIAEESDGRVDWEGKTAAARFFQDGMEKVHSRVLAKGEQVGPNMYQAISQELRDRVDHAGKLTKSEQDDSSSLGPAPGMPAKLQAKEPIERVPVTDPDRGTNIMHRLMQGVAKAAGKAQSS